MQYLKPELKQVLDLRQFAHAQYSTITTIEPDDGCPDVTFDKATGTGVVDFSAVYSISLDYFCAGQKDPTTCEGSISITGTATYQDNQLIVECSDISTECNWNCNESCASSGGEICVESFIVNGESVATGNTCVDIDSTTAQLIQRNMENGCDFTNQRS